MDLLLRRTGEETDKHTKTILRC